MNMENQPKARRDTSTHAIDLIGLLDVLWRAWRLIAITTTAIFGLGVCYAWLATPVYESDLLVQIENSGDNAGTELLGSLSSFLGVKSSDDAEIEILRSRRVIGAAVDQTHYDILAEPSRFPIMGNLIARGRSDLSEPGLFGFGGYAWGGESIELDRFQAPAALYDEPFSLVVLGDGRYHFYRVSLFGMASDYVGQVGETAHVKTDAGEVILNVKAIHALPGTHFKLRRLSRQLTVADLQQHLGVIDKAKEAGIIAVSLQSTRPQRATALLKSLGESYVRQNSEQKSEEAEKSLTFLEQQLPALKSELRVSEDALLKYRDEHGAVDLSESAKLSMGQAAALQTRISLLEQDRQAKLQQFTRVHPAVVAIDSQVALLKREMQGLDAQIKILPRTEQDVMRLTRDVRVNTDLYVAMLNSMQQLRLLRAGKVGNVRIVDNAELPEQPIKPRRALVVLGSLLLGMFAGICIALLRSLWKGAVTDPRDIEQLLDTAVQATVPVSKQQARSDRLSLRHLRMGTASRVPVALSHPQEPAVESLRGLSIAVQLRIFDARNALVLFTSPTQGIGKSFVTANLAVLLAKAGRRVLLIDGDLRKGALHRAFGASESRGFATLLQGKSSLSEVVQPTGIAGLDLLSTGAKPANPTELLQDSRLGGCLAEALANYDITLIDTAPLLPVADTMLLAKQAGTVYAVARYGVTSEGELIETRARLARAGIEFDGVVLNGVLPSLHGSQYGQYGYASYVSPMTDGDLSANGKPA
ncbi:MAG: polysaccharide biosynthesis tyrosine autokinase [Rhodanobacter sp.]